MIYLLNIGTPGVDILRGLSTEILDHHITWEGRETTLMVENHGQGYHPVTTQASDDLEKSATIPYTTKPR